MVTVGGEPGIPVPNSGNPPSDQNSIVRKYPYTDAEGNTVHKVLRNVPKNSLQARPDPQQPKKLIVIPQSVGHVPYYRLPILLDESRRVVFVIEDEKDASNLNRLFDECKITDSVAITLLDGVSNAKDWPGFIKKYQLESKRVIVIPDSDEPSFTFGQDVCKASMDAGCLNVRIVQLPFEEKGDTSDFIKLRRGEGRSPVEIYQEIETLCQQVENLTNETIAQQDADKGKPDTTNDTEPSESFPVDALPGVLKDFVVETANSIGIAPAFIAVPMLSVISGTMGRLFRLQLKKDFSVLPAIWTVVVASSGTGKTPALNKVLEPIRYWQKLADQGDPSLEKPVEPTFEQFLVDDVTTAAMAEIFAQNPFGVILPQDELSGFLHSFDTYSGGKGVKDLAFWLSAFEGIPVRVNRKTKPKFISAPTPSVAITGGIQPGMLRKSFQKNPQFLDSGLTARFLFAMPQDPPIMWSDDEISDEVKDRYAAILDRFIELRRSGNISPEYPFTFSPSLEARDLYRAFFNANATEQVGLDSDSGRATWAKLPVSVAKIALVFHVVEWMMESDKIPRRVSEETMAAAIRLTNWFKGEAVRILQIMTVKDKGKFIKYNQAETQILEAIHTIENKGKEATAYGIKRLIRKYQEPGGDEALERKLSEMVKAGILETEHKTNTGGREKTVYRIHSSVAETPPVATVAVAERSIFPEKNDTSSNSNNHNGVVIATSEPDPGGQEQAGDAVTEKQQQQSVPPCRRVVKKVVKRKSAQKPEPTPYQKDLL